MSRAEKLIAKIEAHGGRFTVDGGDLLIEPMQVALPLRAQLIEHKQEIIRLLRQQEGSGPDPDQFRECFIRWFDFRIWLDAKSVALRTEPRWFTATNALHADFVRWMLERNHAPPTGTQFRSLLRELSCAIHVVGGVELIANVALRSDLEAHDTFQREPVPESSPPVSEPVPEPLPPPVTATMALPEGLTLPDGVRLVRWAPKPVPVRLSPSETVIGVEQFAAATLRQLENEMHGRHWRGGGWGGVPGLLDRLRAVGVVVEVIVEPPRPKKGGGR